MQPNDNSSDTAASVLAWKKLRRQAEELARQQSDLSLEDPDGLSPAEMRRTLHELQVHQIELEMQNEELRRAQTELDAARARYFDLYDLAPVGYCTLSEKGLIIEANLTAARLLAVTRKALARQPIFRFIHPVSQDTYYMHRKHLFETGTPQVCEMQMVKGDGTPFWAQVTATAAQDSDGAAVCRIALSDVTNRKLAEDALKESEESNRLLIESSLDAIIMSNNTGDIIVCNKAMENLTHIKVEDLCKETIWDFHYQLAPVDIKTPELLELFKTEYLSMFKRLKTSQGKRTEQKIKLLNGSVKTIRESSFIIDTQRGMMYVAILHDVSDHIQREEELKLAQKTAEEANAENIAKSQFLANMSHEIRTPMNGFMGILQLLEMTELTEQQQEYLNISKTSSEGLLAVINDILDYSKIEAGKMDLEQAPFSLRKAIREVISLFEPSAASKEVALVVMIDEALPDTCIGDAFRLKQILSNLVGNAIKFTRVGRIEVAVRQIEKPVDETLTLEFVVTDTGIGISTSNLSALFQSFSQVDSSTTRKYGGTGLGLVISKRLVEMMSGEIAVQSTEGQGSRFTFTCVLGLAHDEYLPVPTFSWEHKENPPEAPPMLLLAEDDALSWMLLKEFARKKGWHVTVAENGQEAVDAVQHSHFDVILMDVQMPVMDGFSATRIIRQMESLTKKHTPIIALTAHALKGDMEKCLEAGMDDFLPKPVDMHVMEQRCLEWIARSREGIAP